MFALLRLLLVLAAASHGTAIFCNAIENKPLTQCYGALGQSILIHLITNNRDHDLTITLRNLTIFSMRNKKPTFKGHCSNNCSFLPNGIFKLEKVDTTLSGTYLFEVFNSNGRMQQQRLITLDIKVPVSLPVLSQHCLSHDQMRVSCFSQGDDPQYSWTLDDRPLDGGVAYLSNETQTATLKKDVSGALTCTVRNLVSSSNTTQELFTCPDYSKNIWIPVALGIFFLLLVLLLTICCLHKKKQHSKTSLRTLDERTEDPLELVYSQVTVVKNKEPWKKKEQETEVIYGDVKVSGYNEAVRCIPESQGDMVYARIHN